MDKHTNTCVRTYTYLATHKYICPYIHTNIYVRTYAQIYTSVRTPEYICPYIHIPICTHLCIRLLHVPVCLNSLHISRCLVGALANKYKWIQISSTNEYKSQWIQISRCLVGALAARACVFTHILAYLYAFTNKYIHLCIHVWGGYD